MVRNFLEIPKRLSDKVIKRGEEGKIILHLDKYTSFFILHSNLRRTSELGWLFHFKEVDVVAGSWGESLFVFSPCYLPPKIVFLLLWAENFEMRE